MIHRDQTRLDYTRDYDCCWQKSYWCCSRQATSYIEDKSVHTRSFIDAINAAAAPRWYTAFNLVEITESGSGSRIFSHYIIYRLLTFLVFKIELRRGKSSKTPTSPQLERARSSKRHRLGPERNFYADITVSHQLAITTAHRYQSICISKGTLSFSVCVYSGSAPQLPCALSQPHHDPLHDSKLAETASREGVYQ